MSFLVENSLPDSLIKSRLHVGCLETAGGFRGAADTFSGCSHVGLDKIVGPLKLRKGVSSVEDIPDILLEAIIHKRRASTLAVRARDRSRLSRVKILVVKVLQSTGSVASRVSGHVIKFALPSCQRGVQRQVSELRHRAGVRFGRRGEATLDKVLGNRRDSRPHTWSLIHSLDGPESRWSHQLVVEDRASERRDG